MSYWREKTLAQMSPEEWEGLCDGCGKCCLHKMIDEDDQLLHTNVACRLLDVETIRCTNYPNRKRFVADCTVLTADALKEINWLPETCGYMRVACGEDLPEWHHLRSGSYSAMHEGGHSVQGRIISEREAGPLEHHVLDTAP